ncbi:MAG: hypothetical protein M1820_009656 [Bogoriella megaspora]|nr:MAG: hypothetical protein M1820_009656 [Bogoriella megaspora]
MLDPFPLPSPGPLQRLTQPLAHLLSLPTLPLHIHEVLFAVLLYHLVNTRFSPWISHKFFPRTYSSLNARTRINWDVHVVSMVQSLLINTLALWVIWTDDERGAMSTTGRIYGYTGACGLVQAFATGYFLWDFILCALHIDVFGFGLLAHAVSALLVFSLGFRPFLNYYGPVFILYELSTPFLNLHWFFDKLEMTGSTPQLYNGMLLIGTFFGARLCWGTANSVRVFWDIWRVVRRPEFAVPEALGLEREAGLLKEPVDAVGEVMRFAVGNEVPLWLTVSYLASNFVLNSLNIWWFGKMIDTVRKRFDPPLGTKGVEGKKKKSKGDGSASEANGAATSGRELDVDERRNVEVEGAEIRSRRRVI